MNAIPYGRQNITEEDIKAVVETLRSDYLTQGPKIAEFEHEFANYVGSKYAIAVANGTAALHLCALALDLKSGEKVITTPITFAASANCIRYCGGEVVFSDIDPDSYLLDIAKVEELIKSHPKGTFKGIIPVDFGGRAVNLQVFRKLADEHDLWIIEDACHAPGGYFIDQDGQHQNCGNGKFSDLAIFSFHPVKHIAAGEGGMITTNDQRLYQRLLKLRTHGITRNATEYQNPLNLAIGQDHSSMEEWPGWYMEMHELGYNYRLTDFQCALGMSQLRRAEEGVHRRRELAKKYYDHFKDCTFVKNQSAVIEGHAYHLYIMEVEDRLGLYNHLLINNIYAQIHYIPCHLMPYYRRMGWKPGDLPLSERYYSACISLPMFPTLTDAEFEHVISAIDNYYL